MINQIKGLPGSYAPTKVNSQISGKIVKVENTNQGYRGGEGNNGKQETILIFNILYALCDFSVRCALCCCLNPCGNVYGKENGTVIPD